MSKPIALLVKDLSVRFGARPILNRIGLEVTEGECIALVGANGAGKTTLLRCLASLLEPATGEVSWFGVPAARDLARRRLVGMVAHQSFLYPHLTTRENLLFAARMYGVPAPTARVEALLDGIGLRRHADRLSR
jgi:ABC-type multidrug transport system ATPase subunit